MTNVLRQEWQWPRPAWRRLRGLIGVSHAVFLQEVAKRYDAVLPCRFDDDLSGFDPDVLRWRLTHPAPLPAVTFTSTRVRCGGVWHEVVISDGALRMPHDPVELRRERTVGALGGVVNGCAAVETSWHDGPGWLPKALRVQRRDFFGHARRGDTDMIVHLLDNGFDPLVRDSDGKTLLHYLPALDHTRLLPRLSELGLSLNVEDVGGNTPLSTARHHGADDLAEALVAHGAHCAPDFSRQRFTHARGW